MSLKHGIPEPWNTALLDAGLVNPWGTASLSALAEKADVHVATISRIIKGLNANGPSPKAINAIAAALQKPANLVGSWSSSGWNTLGEYIPPDVAIAMDRTQREIVDEIIKQFATSSSRKAGTAVRPQ